MMGKIVIGILCAFLASCAGYKEIKTSSPDFLALSVGDTIWVYTGVVTRKRVAFVKLEGDSLFSDRGAFHADSITRILKETKPRDNSGIVAGGLVVVWVASIVAAVTFAITMIKFILIL